MKKKKRKKVIPIVSNDMLEMLREKAKNRTPLADDAGVAVMYLSADIVYKMAAELIRRRKHHNG